MTEIDAWYTLKNLFEVTDILEHKEYDLRNWRDVSEIVSTLNKVTENAFRLQKENEQLKASLYAEQVNTAEVINSYSKQFRRHSAEFKFMEDLAEDLGIDIKKLEASNDQKTI